MLPSHAAASCQPFKAQMMAAIHHILARSNKPKHKESYKNTAINLNKTTTVEARGIAEAVLAPPPNHMPNAVNLRLWPTVSSSFFVLSLLFVFLYISN